MKGIRKNSCCVCGHDLLGTHIDEGEWWRCHALGEDAMQCECVLRKDKADSKMEFYDRHQRVVKACQEYSKEDEGAAADDVEKFVVYEEDK